MRPMTKTESFSGAKNPAHPEKNEDALIDVPGKFYGVVDGATSQIEVRPGITGGQLVAQTIAQYFEIADPTLPPAEHVPLLTQAVRAAVGAWSHPPDVKPPCAVFAVYIPHHEVVLRVGDCHIRIDDTQCLGRSAMDDWQYGFRAAVTRGRTGLGATTITEELERGTYQQAFAPLLAVQGFFLNHATDPLGFGAISLNTVPTKFIEVIPVGNANRLVLCTDGLFEAPESVEEGMVALARRRARDPLLCEEAPYAGKGFLPNSPFFDDTTIIVLER